MPSTAWAQPPAAAPSESTTEAPAAVAAPAEGSKAAVAEAQAEEAQADGPTEPAASAPTGTIAPTFTPVAAPPPPPVVVAAPPRPTGPQLNKHAEPLLAAGLGGFAGIYLLTAYAGAATIDKARDISRSDTGYADGYGYGTSRSRDGKMTRNRGRALLIPVAGPFIAMHFTNSARRKYWQAVNGGLQAGSLAMAIIGTRMYAKHRRAKRRAQVTASASPEGAQLGMSMRF